MNGPQITVVGHLAWPPRSRTLAGGTVVADFRIGTTPRRFDKSSGQWSDLETLWFGVTCWRDLAEHATTSLKKGDRVVVTGRLSTKSWTTKEGEQRSGLEIDASSVGLDLARGPVSQTRAERTSASSDHAYEQASDQASDQAPEPDAWSVPPVEVDPLTGEISGRAAA